MKQALRPCPIRRTRKDGKVMRSACNCAGLLLDREEQQPPSLSKMSRQTVNKARVLGTQRQRTLLETFPCASFSIYV